MAAIQAKTRGFIILISKELVDNKFGTANPIPFRVVDRNIGLDIDVSVRCNGVYSYKIVDPLLFYTNVCGNVEQQYDREEIEVQLKTEFVSALQPAFAKISELQIRPSAIPGHVLELCDAMNEALTKKWQQTRGLAVVSIAMNPVTLPEEDAQLIKDAQKNAILRDPTMAAATLAGAQADAMKSAASNTAGAMTGFRDGHGRPGRWSEYAESLSDGGTAAGSTAAGCTEYAAGIRGRNMEM